MQLNLQLLEKASVVIASFTYPILFVLFGFMLLLAALENEPRLRQWERAGFHFCLAVMFGALGIGMSRVPFLTLEQSRVVFRFLSLGLAFVMARPIAFHLAVLIRRTSDALNGGQLPPEGFAAQREGTVER